MKRKHLILTISAIVLLGIGFLLGILLKGEPTANTAVSSSFPSIRFYKDGKEVTKKESTDFINADIKELHYFDDKITYISHPHGFQVDLPPDVQPDFSIAGQVVHFKSETTDITISQEEIPEGYDPQSYIREYMHRYLLEPSYLEYNRITLHKNAIEKVRNMTVQIIALERIPAPGSSITKNTYVHCYLHPDHSTFYRILFKANDYNDALISQIYKTLYSFNDTLEKKGIPKTNADFHPVLPDDWSKETRNMYHNIAKSDTVSWGAFIPGVIRDKNLKALHELEKKIDYSFDVLLEYINHNDLFPKENLEMAYEQGKIVELTMQVSSIMNSNLAGFNPVFEVIDGVHEETFRQLARDAKAFGKPFLFRLNNEMNSDWVSYGATATLNDPELYIQLWRYVYNIFEEEGVNNAIWIFNPNNNSFPPQNYNHMLAYYPGNEYVHMFGITGYNTGTYYKEENNEKWFSFENLYDNIQGTSEPYFKEFPWIITEFGSSSVGGDKPQWITDMFATISKYKNIKIAVWFNADDLDPRPEKNNQVARPYRLDETKQTTEAFKKGIAAFK